MSISAPMAEIPPAALAAWSRLILEDAARTSPLSDSRAFIRRLRAERCRKNTEYIGRSKRWERRA